MYFPLLLGWGAFQVLCNKITSVFDIRVGRIATGASFSSIINVKTLYGRQWWYPLLIWMILWVCDALDLFMQLCQDLFFLFGEFWQAYSPKVWHSPLKFKEKDCLLSIIFQGRALVLNLWGLSHHNGPRNKDRPMSLQSCPGNHSHSARRVDYYVPKSLPGTHWSIWFAKFFLRGSEVAKYSRVSRCWKKL